MLDHHQEARVHAGTRARSRHRVAGALMPASVMASLVMLTACSDDRVGPGLDLSELGCSLDAAYFASGGVGRDAIPALVNPPMTTPENATGLDYLEDVDRVVGVLVDGEPIAVPLNILYHHEIVNFDGETENIAVTYCPLTGSSLAFDRASVNGAEFGVSGLLYQSNLIMYDRVSEESLWPQMFAGARCGPKDGQAVARAFSIETTWAGWQALYPATRVLTSATGHVRDYTSLGNPYRIYEGTNNWWFPIPSGDSRLPSKERVLGIPDGSEGGVAFGFGDLADAFGDLGVSTATVGGESVVVFWDGDKVAAGAFLPVVDGQPATFEVGPNGIVDVETGSTWTVDGSARTGPLAGTRLEPHPDAYTAFWRAWRAFNRLTDLWQEPS